jgi:hypothetical protein
MGKKKESGDKIGTTNDNEQFPFEQFPWKLIYVDGKEKKTCYFQNEIHMKKHIERYKLNKKNYKTSCMYEN